MHNGTIIFLDVYKSRKCFVDNKMLHIQNDIQISYIDVSIIPYS